MSACMVSFTMGKQARKSFDKNGMTDIRGGLPPGAGSETGEEGVTRLGL